MHDDKISRGTKFHEETKFREANYALRVNFAWMTILHGKVNFKRVIALHGRSILYGDRGYGSRVRGNTKCKIK